MKILYSNCLGINAFYKQYQAKLKSVIKQIGLNLVLNCIVRIRFTEEEVLSHSDQACLQI